MFATLRTVAVSTAFVAACAIFTVKFSNAHQLPAGVVRYTIESEERVGLTGEEPHLSARYVFALRSDGATAVVTTKYNRAGSVHAVDRDLLLPGGIRAEVSDHLRVVTATKPVSPLPAGTAVRLHNAPPASCADQADGAPGERILGFSTIKTIKETPAMRLTRWIAPALGCAELRQVAEFKGSDGRITDTSDRNAVRVLSTEPDNALFDWPVDYENVPPSERYLRAASHCKCPTNPSTLQALKQQDQDYLKRRYVR